MHLLSSETCHHSPWRQHIVYRCLCRSRSTRLFPGNPDDRWLPWRRSLSFSLSFPWRLHDSFDLKLNICIKQRIFGVVTFVSLFDAFQVFRNCFLPPATKLRKKVMFLHLCVILFTGGYLSEGGGLYVGVSVRVGSLSRGRGLCQGDPPYGKERAVRILLECILVIYFAGIWLNMINIHKSDE